MILALFLSEKLITVCESYPLASHPLPTNIINDRKARIGRRDTKSTAADVGRNAHWSENHQDSLYVHLLPWS